MTASEGWRFYGEITLPNGNSLPFVTFCYKIKGIYFWSFSIAIGALEELSGYDLAGYPLGTKKDRKWVIDLSKFFYHLAREIFRNAAFDSGGIGYIAGCEEDIKDLIIETIPQERWFGYLLNQNDKLRWFAPNKFGGPILNNP